ncbi:glycosyltransferase family 2 protein [Dongia deserti]|uniref:glycosyltransferase family 2 protein n=1 Tax=Dongia deserti TaxID=2268030 RepID=UPI000E650802|nr:glycosyltransferase family A protein [Dongia deserti]
MIDGGPLVSVVVPAFNAAKTISGTLHSISQQTHRTLEVVVVDDGSTDDTAEIARRHSIADPRFRVVSKPNEGVASARNAGIKASTGAFIAFIDADDLWHPTKIAKQLQALLASGPETALVYSPFRLIDADGMVLASPHKYGVSGWVLHRHFHTNLVGNGSALLIRREVIEEFGGFDTSLRQQDAEGCEDLLLQLRIAGHYRFGEVAEYLVGYRRIPDNMSSNAEQMIRSGILAVSQAFSEYRDVPGLSASAMLKRYEWQNLKMSIRKWRARESLRSFARQFASSPLFVIRALWTDLPAVGAKLQRALSKLAWNAEPLRHFYDFDPKEGIDLNHDTPTSRALRRLAKLDRAYRPKPKGSAISSSRSLSDGAVGASTSSAFASGKLNCISTYQEG